MNKSNTTAISFLSVIPLRVNPSHSSEMVSQILFGELFEVTEKTGEWVKIKTQYDDYEGWLDEKQIVYVDAVSQVGELNNRQTKITGRLNNKVFKESDNQPIYLPAGVILPDFSSGKFTVAGHNYILTDIENAIAVNHENFQQEVLAIAQQFLNTPYLWGGRTHFGIDCSGFSQTIYKIFGLKIKRDAWQQAEQGQSVNTLEQAQTGDLAFFDNEKGRITHVGIMINNNKIIHASGRVKIDNIDADGIFSSDLQQYTHKLKVIKRYI